MLGPEWRLEPSNDVIDVFVICYCYITNIYKLYALNIDM